MRRENRRSFMDMIKNRAKKGVITSRGVKQGESQKIDFIFPVLEYLLQHIEFYASEIKRQIPEISYKSIDNTILLLQKKNLIVHDRTEIHNKKIFRVKSKIELKKYQDELYKYRSFKIISTAALQTKKVRVLDRFSKFGYGVNRMGKSLTKAKFVLDNLNYFTNKFQKIINKSTYDKSVFGKKYSKSTTIEEIDFLHMLKIIVDYAYGKICEICFQENRLEYTSKEIGEFVCNYGHVTTFEEVNNEIFKKDQKFDPSKNAKRLTDKQFRKDVKKYLRKKNTNSQSEYSEYIDDI